MKRNPRTGARSSGVIAQDSRLDTGGGSVVGRDNIGGDKFVINTALFARMPPQDGQSTAVSSSPPRLLPYLTDRTDQVRRLTTDLQSQLDCGANKALTFFAVGREDECLDSFAEQVRFLGLPAILKSNDMPTNVLFRRLRWPNAERRVESLGQDDVHLVQQVTEQIYEIFALKTTADKTAIEQRLASISGGCLLHISLSLDEWESPRTGIMMAWLRWLSSLNLTKVRSPIVTLICVVHPSGFFSWLRSRRALSRLRRDIHLLLGNADFGPAVRALPELGSVQFDDVDKWIMEYVDNVDHEVLRRRIRRHFLGLLGFGQRRLSMYRTAEIVKSALNDPTLHMSPP